MSNSAAALDRLARGGYQQPAEWGGCARCVHSDVEIYGAGKRYFCKEYRAEVQPNGRCPRFVKMETQQQELPFVQSVMREIAGAVGHAVAFQLVRRWGGRELRVPVALDEHHPLALTLGLDAAHRVVRAFGGQKLELPLEVNVLRQRRDQAVADAVDSGLSEEKVAIEWGLTRQAVRAIVAKVREQQGATTESGAA